MTGIWELLRIEAKASRYGLVERPLFVWRMLPEG